MFHTESAIDGLKSRASVAYELVKESQRHMVREGQDREDVVTPLTVSKEFLVNADVLREEVEDPYVPPPINFIQVLFGASERVILNTNCRRKIFMNCLKQKIGAKAKATIDLCDEDGCLLGLDHFDENQNIDHLFRKGETYLPCVISRSEDGNGATIKPYLKQWAKLYPQMEENINSQARRNESSSKPMHIQKVKKML